MKNETPDIDDKFEELVRPSVDRTLIFDRFLTYRKRIARLVTVQVMYLYDINHKINYNNCATLFTDIDSQNKTKKDIVTLCQEVIYFYKTSVFGPMEYGWNRKNKKVDEAFVYELITHGIKNIDKIDNFISSHLNANWNLSRLDFVLRAIFRVAMSEVLLGQNRDRSILTSEYTDITANFFSGKEVGFANAVLESMCKDSGLKKKRDFKQNIEKAS